MIAQGEEAVCANREGTNAMIALLANAMARELGRWEALTDFERFRGYNNQDMVRVKAGAPCTNGCAEINAILTYQDSRLDQQFKFIDGTKLSSWSFASRLTTGMDNQKSCKNGGWCPYEAHTLTFQSSVPGSCDTLSTYGAAKAVGGGNLVNAGNLKNALKFTEGNGPNPYISFSSTASTVTIDPGNEGANGSGSGSDTTLTVYQKFSPVAATGANQFEGKPCVVQDIAPPSKMVRGTNTNPSNQGYVFCTHY